MRIIFFFLQSSDDQNNVTHNTDYDLEMSVVDWKEAFRQRYCSGETINADDCQQDDQPDLRFFAKLNDNSDAECCDELTKMFKKEYFKNLKIIGDKRQQQFN